MKALRDGESSHTYRVRAADGVHRWLAGMTAEQRGEVLTRAQQDAERPAQLTGAQTPDGAAEGASRAAQRQPEAPLSAGHKGKARP